MKKYKIPAGTSDYLPGECYIKNLTEDRILSVFKSNGYERIETPSIEYDNVFSGVDDFMLDEAFKMTDTDGSLIILRPDMTMPLARIAATKNLGEPPLKLCYLGNSFTLLSDGYRCREFTQAGLELIGEGSYLADAEVIAVAIDALRAAGLDDFLIEVGNVGFFRGLIEECGLDEKSRDELIKNVDRKNNFAIYETLKKAGTPQRLVDTVSQLPTLFGDDAFDRAKKLIGNKKSLGALDELQNAVGLLERLGYGRYISVDLGLLKSPAFYTGTIFKGISRHFGAPILSGGRYDKLFPSADGSATPATGFAVGIKNLVTALSASGKTQKKPTCDCVLGAAGGDAEKAFLLKRELIAKGYTVSYVFIESETELRKYAERVGAKKAVFVR
ncbi:MAG: ATP phosphoribosyltransferase regulatory subunit [Clostridiales bacterium]|jgi:ATP phosphoribosyltransferase regulatory subunit|nr:ATP phosphoribosyltransferase regulatory subunit [Clostridiales bacterium]